MTQVKGAQGNPLKPWRVTVHCSDTENGKYVSVATIRKWHLERGFRDIGYHMVIEPSGEVEYGRPLWEKGAHVKGANEGNIGICLIGRDRFTEAQFEMLRDKIDGLIHVYPSISPGYIYCHYEFESARVEGKSCPNIPADVIRAWYINPKSVDLKPYTLLLTVPT